MKLQHHRLRSIGLLALLTVLTSALIAPVSAQGITFTELTSAILPWDATTSPDGTTIYYTAIAENGVPAVFSIPAAGGEPTVLAQGEAFAMPLGIDVSSDGKTLYIADPWVAGAGGNALFELPSDGSGSPLPLTGTRGTSPQSVTVCGDAIYFAGLNPITGQPAIFKTTKSGLPQLVTQGAPLVAPAGIAVTETGTVYVLDRLADAGQGSVLRFEGDAVETIASDVRIGGQMPGVALTLDESLLFVSSLDPMAGTAQVLAINLATLDTSVVNDVIGMNTAAGGLHRAHDVDTFAWASSLPPNANGRQGSVYSVIWGT